MKTIHLASLRLSVFALSLVAVSLSAQTWNVGTAYVSNLVVAANVAPTITDEPDSIERTNGTSATFTITATGTAPLAYQWAKTNVPIAGATLTSYTINPVTNSDAGSFRCVVTNAYGAITSAAAVLTVYDVYTPPSTNGFCDTFTSYGAAWETIRGGWSITSSQLVPTAEGWDENLAVYTNTACATVNQYAKVRVMYPDTGRAGVIFRFTDTNSPFYIVRFDAVNQLVRWFYMTNAASDVVLIADTSIAIASNTVFGVNLNATGDDTTVRIWTAITNDAPDQATSWDSDYTPEATFADNPPAPVNTGSKVGLGAIISGADEVRLDDFCAGDIPVP